jgi:uncharacterized integral membrane protein
MTVEREPQHAESRSGEGHAAEQEKPRTWALPLFFVALLVIPAAILVLSNTDSREIGFAGLTWEAPLWIILAITFAAGAILTKVVGRAWGAIRRRSLRRKAEYDRARRAAQSD